MLKKQMLILFTFYISLSQSSMKNDSIFKAFSIDNILKYKNSLELKKEQNNFKRNELSQVGLSVNKNILESKYSIGANQDVMLLRLAEFFNEEADKVFFEKFEIYNKNLGTYFEQLEKFEEDSVNNPRPIAVEEPVKDISKSIELYDRIINEFSNSEMIDDAYYQKAFLLAENNLSNESREVYQELIDKYPDSEYTPSAIMALGLYYFDPSDDLNEEERLEFLQKAILMFKRVLKYKESDRYAEALYYLGWSFYKMAARDYNYYKDAVAYFTLVLDDIYTGKTLKKAAKYTNRNIEPEAIEYIGISFYQEDNKNGGVNKLRKFVEKLKQANKAYSSEVMKSLGDIYYRVREQENTITSYSIMQELFPFHPKAAETQKRIVESYRVYDKDIKYESDSKSFSERYNMFKKYNTKSDWYKQLLNSDIAEKFEILNAAVTNAEEALRTNIILMYQDILDKENNRISAANDYGTLATMCEEYLSYFPNSDFAFAVHRSYAEILDTKMNKYEKAYEEYLAASNIYPNENLDKIKSVAYNAIIVADTLRGIAGDKNFKFKFNPNDSAKPQELSVSEKRLVEAYQNYLRISDNDSNSAKFLSNLSAIFFNRQQFTKAKQFNKTLLKRFPGAEGEALARQQLMNVYFASGQFISSEVMAKRIIEDKSSDPQHLKDAKDRLFESILKNAQMYEKRNQHYIAGLEYRRAVLEAPFEERPNFKFIALTNSGNEFTLASEHEDAIESYRLLLTEADKNNPYTRKALVNTAFAYQELKQFKVAGEYFEKVYIDYPDSADAKNYLLNAGKFYQDGSMWNDVIRVNNIYASRYPTDEISKDLLFDNANHFLKLDDFDSANKIYNEFSAKYPDDPRTIEAFYKRGKYFLEKDQINQARPEFENAIARNEKFKKENKKNDDYHAAESAHELIQLQLKDFALIKFKWPTTNIEKMKKTQKEQFEILKKNYERLIVYSSPRAITAPFHIAELFEYVAETFSSQETDPNEKNQAKVINEEQKIRATSANLYEAAIEKYKVAMKDIRVIAEKLKINLDSNYEDSIKVVTETKSKINLDSLRNLALDYIEKSKEKITSIVFLVAKQSEENIYSVLNYKSEYDGKVGKENLKLEEKSIILEKSVSANIQKSIAAHRRNLITSVELKVENKYTEESKRRMVINNNIIANEFLKLSRNALQLFTEYYNEFTNLIPKKYGAKGPKFKKTYADLEGDVENFLELATNYSNKALNSFKATIESSRGDSIQNDLTEYTELSILNVPLEYVNIVTQLNDSIKKKKESFQKRYDQLSEDDESKYNYEDGKSAAENFLFTIDANIIAALDEAFKLAKEMNLPRTSSYNKILKMLIQRDAATYAGDIPKDEILLSSDASWKLSKSLDPNINQIDFDESNWKNAVEISDMTAVSGFDTLNTAVKTIWYPERMITAQVIDSSKITNLPNFYLDSLTSNKVYYTTDSLGQRTEMELDTVSGLPMNFKPVFAMKTMSISVDSLDTVTVYFRKKVQLEGKLYSAQYIATGDGQTDFFVNNTFIQSFDSVEFGKINKGDHNFFKDYIVTGENVFSIWVKDFSKPRQGLKFYLKLLVLPKEFSQEGDTIIDETTRLDEKDERKVQYFIKNRINVSKIKTEDKESLVPEDNNQQKSKTDETKSGENNEN